MSPYLRLFFTYVYFYFIFQHSLKRPAMSLPPARSPEHVLPVSNSTTNSMFSGFRIFSTPPTGTRRWNCWKRQVFRVFRHLKVGGWEWKRIRRTVPSRFTVENVAVELGQPVAGQRQVAQRRQALERSDFDVVHSVRRHVQHGEMFLWQERALQYAVCERTITDIVTGPPFGYDAHHIRKGRRETLGRIFRWSCVQMWHTFWRSRRIVST